MPIAEANLALESKMAVASPRSLRGNHTPMALALPGNVGASAMPSNSRAEMMAAKPRASPVANEATLHRNALMRMTGFTP